MVSAPRRYTVTDLILRAQQRVPMVSQDVWRRLISEACAELYTIAFGAGLRW